MSELKACPFCGGEAVVRKSPQHGGPYVRCSPDNNCLIMPLTRNYYVTVGGAIAAWNERSGDE